jgi:hypothetical protein
MNAFDASPDSPRLVSVSRFELLVTVKLSMDHRVLLVVAATGALLLVANTTAIVPTLQGGTDAELRYMWSITMGGAHCQWWFSCCSYVYNAYQCAYQVTNAA